MLDLPLEALAALCRRDQVRELSLFGSALRNVFRPGSDLDLLVTFDSEAEVGFLDLAGLQRELAGLVGRSVDMVPKQGLKLIDLPRKLVLGSWEPVTSPSSGKPRPPSSA